MNGDLTWALRAAQDFGEQYALRLTPTPPAPAPRAVEPEGP